VTICHCTFCQKITGSAYLVEPIFKRDDVLFSGARAKAFAHRSDVSGMTVTVNFCATCGTSISLDLERFPDVVGLFGGTFDDPNWFDRTSKGCRHIFTRSAQDGVILPAGVDMFAEHALKLDGTPNQPTVLDRPMVVSRKRS
jgi:hypothetical protein